MSIKATAKMRLIPELEGTVLGKEIEKIIDREIDSYAHRMKTALTSAFKVILQEAAETWYADNGLATGSIIASAVQAKSDFVRSTRYQKAIQITGFFDSGILASMGPYYPKAVQWSNTYSEYCDMTAGEYIFSLRWNYGYLILPPKSDARGLSWVNPHCVVAETPLKDYCAKQLREQLPIAASTISIGKRNQNMGAGIFSKNNSGLGNLKRW